MISLKDPLCKIIRRLKVPEINARLLSSCRSNISQAEHAHDATCSKPLIIILTKCFQEANALFQAVTHIDESLSLSKIILEAAVFGRISGQKLPFIIGE